MKKVIYSIITAFLLCVILTLLIPRLLFKGDARWTYQSDAARVDVSFKGHLKNGHVGAAGADLQISQPAWLSDESYQGTVIEFPASYRNRTYQIKLTPEADEWGKDATVILEFRGKDFRHRGKRRPAWVTFQNIALNGQPIAAGKVVWHDRPFLIKFPHAQEITLTFNVCKPLVLSDVSFKNLLGVFLACLILSLFFSRSQKAMIHIPKFIYEKDVVKVVSDGYHHIDSVYRRSFWIIFGVLCFAFGFHTICYMWGNHDWSYLNHNHRWLERAWLGRYMASSVKVLLSGGVYLPLIHDLIILLTLALNAVLLCKYWRLERRVWHL